SAIYLKESMGEKEGSNIETTFEDFTKHGLRANQNQMFTWKSTGSKSDKGNFNGLSFNTFIKVNQNIKEAVIIDINQPNINDGIDKEFYRLKVTSLKNLESNTYAFLFTVIQEKLDNADKVHIERS